MALERVVLSVLTSWFDRFDDSIYHHHPTKRHVLECPSRPLFDTQVSNLIWVLLTKVGRYFLYLLVDLLRQLA